MYMHKLLYTPARLQESLRGKYLKSHCHFSCHITSFSLLILNCTSGPGCNAIIRLFLSGARVSKKVLFPYPIFLWLRI